MRRILLALLLAAPLPGLAQNADVELRIRYSPALQGCLDKAGSTTAAMVDCHAQEYALWDLRLNRAYQRIMSAAEVTPAAKDQLREAQRAWIAYRDRACAARAGVESGGGTLGLITAAACRLEMTAVRAHELEILQ